MTVLSTNSTDHNQGDYAYNSSIRSDWFIANSTANTPSPKAGAFFDTSVDTLPTFLAPNAGVSTILVRHRRFQSYTASSQNVRVAFIGRFNSGGGTPGQWMLLTNRSNVDGVSAPITLTADFTNDIADGTYRFTKVDTDDHWFDTMGCNEFAAIVTTAFAGTPFVFDVDASVIECKFL